MQNANIALERKKGLNDLFAGLDTKKKKVKKNKNRNMNSNSKKKLQLSMKLKLVIISILTFVSFSIFFLQFLNFERTLVNVEQINTKGMTIYSKFLKALESEKDLYISGSLDSYNQTKEVLASLKEDLDTLTGMVDEREIRIFIQEINEQIGKYEMNFDRINGLYQILRNNVLSKEHDEFMALVNKLDKDQITAINENNNGNLANYIDYLENNFSKETLNGYLDLLKEKESLITGIEMTKKTFSLRLQETEKNLENLIIKMDESAKIKTKNLKITTFTSTIVLLVILQTFLFGITRSILQSIRHFRGLITELKDGHLRKREVTARNDEFGQIERYLNEFVNTISEYLFDINNLTDEVETENTKLTKAMNNAINGWDDNGNTCDISTDCCDQRGVVGLHSDIGELVSGLEKENQETKGSLLFLEDIFTTDKSVANSIEKTYSSSEKAAKISKENASKIEEMEAKMNDINNNVEKSTEVISELTGLSKNIDNIVSAITSISEQTNLLALNAAIEAARAGEAGRGFAVVAGEIRKLAEQTDIEASKINTIIQTIQGDVNNVNKSNAIVQTNVKEAKQTTTTLKDSIMQVRGIILENNNNIQDISAAVKDQKVAQEEITKTISKLDENFEKVDQTGSNMTSSADVITELLSTNLGNLHHLSELTAQLKDDMKFFKFN